eukprot:TRINITY_DN3338_c0_g4_i1.p1 TRINITY_DN3338_c0_g4~~TRINITY_DN3338_c0_g4_i1.p1  ORF type:complete len:467 (-),score=41.12 TRINITY_DN3338_c0_g4_i1:35-1393(-)
MTAEQTSIAQKFKDKTVDKIKAALEANQSFQSSLEQKVYKISECIVQARDMKQKIQKCYQQHFHLRQSKQSLRKQYFQSGAGKRKAASFWQIPGYVPQPPPGSQQMQEIINLKLKDKVNWSKNEDDKLVYGLLQYSISRLQLKHIQEIDEQFPIQHQIAQQQRIAKNLRNLSIKSPKIINYINSMDQQEWEDMIRQYCSWIHSYEDCVVRWINYLHPNINKSEFSEDEDQQILLLVMKNVGYVEIAEKLGTSRRPWQVHKRLNEISKAESQSGYKNRWTYKQRSKLGKSVQQNNGDWEMVAKDLDNLFTPLQCFTKHQDMIRNNQYHTDQTDTTNKFQRIYQQVVFEENLERFNLFLAGWTVEDTQHVVDLAKTFFKRPRSNLQDFIGYAVYLFPIPQQQLENQLCRILEDAPFLKGRKLVFNKKQKVSHEGNTNEGSQVLEQTLINRSEVE